MAALLRSAWRILGRPGAEVVCMWHLSVPVPTRRSIRAMTPGAAADMWLRSAWFPTRQPIRGTTPEAGEAMCHRSVLDPTPRLVRETAAMAAEVAVAAEVAEVVVATSKWAADTAAAP